MKTTEKLLSSEQTQHLNTFLEQPQETLFFDIETTGFSPKTSSIYLIGCAFYTKSGWCIRQYFADTPAKEGEIVKAFTSFASTFSHFIHFNGQTFDVPFLQAKCKKHALPAFALQQQCDIYKSISPYKNLLHLPGCRQRQLEEFIGLHREDPFNGGQLIELYRAYGEEKDERLLQVLLLHNLEDLSGMLSLYAIMAIPMLFEEGCFVIEDIGLAQSQDVSGSERTECTLRLTSEYALPVPLSCHGQKELLKQCFLAGRGNAVALRIPVLEGELKYFYPDYKNYSYLPEEDEAIHKSVAVYVDKSRRMPATAKNCYTRKSGQFLPWFGAAPEDVPLFQASHQEKQKFILYDETIAQNRDLLSRYVLDLLKALKNN